MFKKRSIFTHGICLVLFASLLLSNIILAQDGGVYDPWIDINDDGIIDAIDLQALASLYSMSGTPINKTALLLELEARLNSLNASLLTNYYNITVCDATFVDASGDTITGYLYVLGDMNITGYLNVDLGTLYVDDVNDRLGIGNSNPLYKLDVGDIGDLYNYAQVRSTGFCGITFYDGGDGPSGAIIYNHFNDALNFLTKDPVVNLTEQMRITSDGDVGIGIQNPTTKLDVDGNTTIRGTLNASSITIPNTTRYYSMPGCAWQPLAESYDFQSDISTWTFTAGGTGWFAPVHLPHGAVITELSAWVHDSNSTTDVVIWLRRHSGLSYEFMAHVVSSSASPGFVQRVTSSIDHATVDNQNYAYYLEGVMESGNSNHQLSNVRITYTITEPLP